MGKRLLRDAADVVLWDGRKVRHGRTCDVSDAEAAIMQEREPDGWREVDDDYVPEDEAQAEAGADD